MQKSNAVGTTQAQAAEVCNQAEVDSAVQDQRLKSAKDTLRQAEETLAKAREEQPDSRTRRRPEGQKNGS